MDSGLYAAYTGLMGRTQALDTAANNLANAGTTGFRTQHDFFKGVVANSLERDAATSSQVGSAVNGFGVLGGNRLDLNPGQITPTGNPLDVALRGKGFFALQSLGGMVYTRNGAFTRSAQGVLQSATGEPVLDGKQKVIMIPTGSVHIAADGNVSVSHQGVTAIVGRIGVFDFADKSALTAQGADRLVATDGAKPVLANAELEQGSLEGSNEDPIRGTMQLVLVQRQAEMMQKALSVFNNDFDKTATEELPRV